jgi:DNA transformation protein and related proteins
MAQLSRYIKVHQGRLATAALPVKPQLEVPMPSKNKEFALYCCDLLQGVGPCVAKSMFGGWGISCDGLTIALMTDLGKGDKLWLKANDETAAQFRAAGSEQFMYAMKGELKAMNYFTAPDDAMESPALMLPWARLAMRAALLANAAKLSKTTKSSKDSKPTTAKPKSAAKTAKPKPATKTKTSNR